MVARRREHCFSDDYVELLVIDTPALYYRISREVVYMLLDSYGDIAGLDVSGFAEMYIQSMFCPN